VAVIALLFWLASGNAPSPDQIRAQSVDQAFPAKADSAWWIALRRQSETGDNGAILIRVAFVRGFIEALDAAAITGSASYDDYQRRRATMIRDDLSVEQLLLKIDGFYAEPANAKSSVQIAIMVALKPVGK
jgi:hypothetical protein